jgi:hypothetical protein
MANDRQVEALGVFVHGVLTGLHLLGIVYNLRKRNWFDVAAHSSAAAYDTWAVSKHLRALS